MSRLSLVPVVALLVAACSGGAASGSSTAPASVTANDTPAASPAASTAPIAFGDPVGDVRCDLGGHDDAYHIHAQIKITVAGTLTDPDSNIGVDETKCMYWVHTHDGTGGVIHIEAPQDVTVTLADFMGVWSATYPGSPVLAAARAGLDAGTLTVDGSPATGDWRSLALTDKQVLEIR